MENTEYVSLLEASVSTYDSRADKVIDWTGKGDLPTHDDLDDLVDKITTDKKDTKHAVQEESEPKKKDEKESPLSILENELENANETDDLDKLEENLGDAVTFTEQENEILNRLISEMDAMDLDPIGDELLDDELRLTPETEDVTPVEPTLDADDLELGVPQEEYELADLM